MEFPALVDVPKKTQDPGGSYSEKNSLSEDKQEDCVEDSLLVKGVSVDENFPHPQKNQERLMVMGTPEDCGPEMVEAKVEVTSDGVHTVPPVRVKVDNTSKENRLSIPKQVARFI